MMRSKMWPMTRVPGSGSSLQKQRADGRDIRMVYSAEDALRIDRRMADADHGWWFPERKTGDPDLFGVFESNANVLCPDGAEFCSPEIGGWPHTALLCRVEKENAE